MDEIFFSVLDILGVLAFAISGSMVGVRQRLDMLGIIITGTTTAVGGGITRDIILGILPPTAFVNPTNMLIAIITSLIVFFYIRKHKKPITDAMFLKVYTILDAIGLGVFTVIGVNTAIQKGHADNIFLLVFLGTVTGVGGGVIRDVFVRRVPGVLRSEDLYATAAFLGCVFYVSMALTSVPTSISMIMAIALITIIRMASLMFRLRMPKAHHKDEE